MDFLAEERNTYYQNILVEVPRMVFELFSFTEFLAEELHELFGQRTKHFGGNAKDGFELFSFTDFLAEERNIYHQSFYSSWTFRPKSINASKRSICFLSHRDLYSIVKNA